MKPRVPVWKKVLPPTRSLSISSAGGNKGVLNEMWHHRWLGYTFIITGTIIVIHWENNVPSPGYALLAMAVAAAVIAVRPEMQGTEKWLWLMLLLAFASVEVRAMRKDHANQEAFQGQLQKNFADIGGGIKASITEGDRNFKETIDRQNELLGNITGAKTFCVVQAVPVGDNFLLMAIAVGPNPLRDVMIDQVDLDLERAALAKQGLTYDAIRSFTTSYPSIPFLVSTSGRQISELPFGPGDKRDLHFNFFTTSGVWGETLSLRRVNEIWTEAFKVTKQVPAPHHQTRDVVIYKQVPPNYPRINGQVDW